jgi:hypothetical protein
MQREDKNTALDGLSEPVLFIEQNDNQPELSSNIKITVL